MLAKILVLIAIFGGLYLFMKRHQIIAKFVDQTKQPDHTKTAAQDVIEELDYDPETGHYKVKDREK